MNGIDTLKEIMRRHPIPVIVVSSHSIEGASITFKALGLGAFDFVTKPQDATAHMADAARQLIAKNQGRCRLQGSAPGSLMGPPTRVEKIAAGKFALAPTKTVAIGISTGGPQALEFLLAQLPPDFPGNDSGGATHAVGLHRHVCPPARRTQCLAGEGSPVGRCVAGRTRSDWPGKPSHDGEAPAHGRRCGAE